VTGVLTALLAGLAALALLLAAGIGYAKAYSP
jgi:hypothetical protein